MSSSNREDVGIVLLLMSLVCLGTWPALLRLASEEDPSSLLPRSENEEEEHQESSVLYVTTSSIGYSSLPPVVGAATTNHSHHIASTTNNDDNPGAPAYHLETVCHAYLDYATAYFLVSSVPFLITVVRNTSVLSMPPLPLVATAMLGGTLLSWGNLSFQWATAVYKASLTFVLAIQASMTIVLGTGINYGLEPHMTKRPQWLFAGMTCFLLAIVMAVQSQLAWMQQKAEAPNEQQPCDIEIIEYHQPNNQQPTPGGQTAPNASTQQEKQSNSSTVVTGLVVAFLGGLCFGFFSPAFNVAVNDPFQWTISTGTGTIDDDDDKDQTLRVVRANFIFSFAFWVASFGGNLWLLQKKQQPQQSMPSLLRRYWLSSTWMERRMALLAGLVCAIGNVLQFQGGQLVGYATADLVQAYPLVSTVWDVLWFGEFHSLRFPSRLATMLLGMYLAYGAGVLLFAGSSVGDG
ncbi:Ureide permease [Seminavis robusta]|uniref:Ureide permease n=1 Tax=Seminavis robusta TaxID=568900 RepID=A0A9N8EZN7_9STRA|nr:Ureide permease [Seminavis robusta]|eukprot:Sro2447_g328010.1 Ureide permease (462) ;mRNA; r:5909-7294